MSKQKQDDRVLNGRHYVGEVGVDSGLVFVGDPCYIKHDDRLTDESKWNQFCDYHHKDDGRPKELVATRTLPNGKEATDINGNVIQYNIGCIISDFGGDGGYDCFVTYNNGLVTKMEVVFHDSNDEEDWD